MFRHFRILAFTALTIAFAALGCSRGANEASDFPRSVVTDSQIELARELVVQRSGMLHLNWIRPVPGSGSASRVRYRLQAPYTTVEDADIRGLLDGTGRYEFNQGLSYHMRVGRRYSGSNEAAFELKRSLVRFDLSEVPSSGSVAEAALNLWVERFLSDSPLAHDSIGLLPLHAYLYPVPEDWAEGVGGVDRNDFSAPATGEVDWTFARNGELPWPAPGGLPLAPSGAGRHYEVAPLAVAPVTGDDRWLSFSSPQLTRHLDSLLASGADASFLIKLGDGDEDRWGTEMAFLTSQFGVDWDALARRPNLLLGIDLPGTSRSLSVPFVLEPGETIELPSSPFPGEEAVLSAEFDDPTGPHPQVTVRTGGDGDTRPLTNPTRVAPDADIRLSAAPRQWELGSPLRLRLAASWVQPGPRSRQRPEFVFIAPSGTLHRVSADSVGQRYYEAVFTPLEPGPWRYAWTFRPAPEWPSGSHQGQGLFYVAPPTDSTELLALRQFGDLILRGDSSVAPLSQRMRANSFVRWNRRFGLKGQASGAVADSLLADFRNALPPGRR